MKIKIISDQKWSITSEQQDTVDNLGGWTSGDQKLEWTSRVHIDSLGHTCRISEASRNTNRREGCASVVGDSWHQYHHRQFLKIFIISCKAQNWWNINNYVTIDSVQIGQINQGQEELKAQKNSRRCQDGTRCDTYRLRSRWDFTSANHRRHKVRTYRSPRYWNRNQCDADQVIENMSLSRVDLMWTNPRRAAVRGGAIYVGGRTLERVLQMRGIFLEWNLKW